MSGLSFDKVEITYEMFKVQFDFALGVWFSI